MINIKEFYCISGDTTEFMATLDVFPIGPLPILWRYKGLYGMIPAAIVANSIQLLSNVENAQPGDVVKVPSDLLPNINSMEPGLYMCRFRWEQTITVPHKIGEQLFNEQFNNQTEQSKG